MYYIDCEKGDDAHKGTSAGQAWKSLDKANQTMLKAGDGIFLRRGITCKGTLQPQGSGQAGAPMTIDAYGRGSKPVVDGEKHEATLRLYNQEYWHIQNIEIRGGTTYGIHITGSENGGTLEHFRLTDLTVHEVYGGLLSDKVRGLVVFQSGGGNNVINDVIVDGVTAYDTNMWLGIGIAGAPWPIDPKKPLLSSNIIFRNNTVHNVYGDGIVLWGVQNGLIESNVAYDTGQQPSPQTIGTPSSIWTWSCYDCTVQFNESYQAKTPDVDGGCYDIDWNTRNNVYQYNYGHDSDGYCFSVFGAENYITSRAVIRYNVCANNAQSASLAARQGDMYFSTWTNGSIDGAQIYNNTFYYNPPRPFPLLVNHATFTGENPNFFKNNLIYANTQWMIESDDTLTFDHNLYWYNGEKEPVWFYDNKAYTSFSKYQQGSGQDTHSLLADPNLDNPTYHEAGKLTDAYHLQAGSPAIDAGKDLGDMGSQDFFGNPIPYGEAYDIGAFEWSPKSVFRLPGEWQAGSLVPSLYLPVVQGGFTNLRELVGEPILLSILNTRLQATRSQIVFLRSMLQQYASRGVRVVIILNDANPNPNELANLIVNLDLEAIPVLIGTPSYFHGANLTYLISSGGRITHGWRGLTLPFQLSWAIQQELTSE